MEPFERDHQSLPSQAYETDSSQISNVLEGACDVASVMADLITKVESEVSESRTVPKCGASQWMQSVLKKIDEIADQLSANLLNPSMVEQMCHFRTTLANIALEDLECLDEPSQSPEATGSGPTMMEDQTRSESLRSEVGHDPLIGDARQQSGLGTSPIDLIVETVDHIVESQSMMKRLQSPTISAATDVASQLEGSIEAMSQVEGSIEALSQAERSVEDVPDFEVSMAAVLQVEGKGDAKQLIETAPTPSVHETQKGRKKKKKKGKRMTPGVAEAGKESVVAVSQAGGSTGAAPQVERSADTVPEVEAKDDAEESIETAPTPSVHGSQKSKKKNKKKGKNLPTIFEKLDPENQNPEFVAKLEEMMERENLPEDLWQAWMEDLNGGIQIEKRNYPLAVEHYHKALLIAQPFREVPRDVPTRKIIEIYEKLGQAYESCCPKSFDVEECLYYALACYKMILKLDVIDMPTRVRCVDILHKLKQYHVSIPEAVVVEKMSNPISMEDSLVMKSDSTRLLLKFLIHEHCIEVERLLSTDRLTFLTSDFVNMWLACRCNDPIIDDLITFRHFTHRIDVNEEPSSRSIGGFESDYVKALDLLSVGRLTDIEHYLRLLVEKKDGKQKCEAYLLLAIAYSRLRPLTYVHECLNGFLANWDKEMPEDVDRRKKMIVRFVSVSRALRADPLAGDPIENATPEMLANMYLQEALIVNWRRYDEGLGQKWYKYKNLHEEHKHFLTNVKCLLDKSLEYQPKCRYAKVFRISVVNDLKMLEHYMMNDNKSEWLSIDRKDLAVHKTEVARFNRRGTCYNPFADLLILSTYLDTGMFNHALATCRKLVKGLMLKSYSLPFLMAYDYSQGDKTVLKRIKMLLGTEMGNYRAHSLFAELLSYRQVLVTILWSYYCSAHLCLMRALAHWPAKDTITELDKLVPRKVRYRILGDAQRSLCEINRRMVREVMDQDKSKPQRLEQIIPLMHNITTKLWESDEEGK